jgi:hypothetical protein
MPGRRLLPGKWKDLNGLQMVIKASNTPSVAGNAID